MSEPKKKAAAQPEHRVSAEAVPGSYVEQGGQAVARCSCGWSESMPYSRDRFRSAALAAVRKSADLHKAGPDE